MIDLNKAFEGLKEVNVCGQANSSMRQEKIEEAIILSCGDPNWEGFFWDGGRKYFGVKNYASCGDQSADCKEGLSPRHGSIVFSIRWKSKVGVNGIYLLKLCAENSQVDVCKLLKEQMRLNTELDEIETKIRQLREFQEDAVKYKGGKGWKENIGSN